MAEHLRVERAGPRGMVTLRGDPGGAALRDAVRAVTGCEVPRRRGAALDGPQAVLWFSPDELLLLMPRDAAPGAVRQLSGALEGSHHLVVDVSDARALFRLTGPGWRDALAKLTPADLHPDAFGPGEVRRTRLAQVAAAFWMTGPDTVELLAFRSVAHYVEGLLANAADPAAPVGHF